MSFTEVSVTSLAVGLPGAEGALSPGLVVPPSQGAPLSLQPLGAPVPLPLNPKEMEAPGARVPFHPRFLAVQWFAELVTVASHAEVTLVPVGKSHSTVQEESAVVPVFFTVHWPSKPEPQSDFLVYVAVAEAAASAGAASPTMAARGRNSAVTPATALARPDRVTLRGDRGRRRGVSVLNDAPRMGSGAQG